MSEHDQIAAHLEFFRELGVDGVSRDAAWRTRPVDVPIAQASAPDESSSPAPGGATPAAGSVDNATPSRGAPHSSAAEVSMLDRVTVPDAASGQDRLDQIRADLGECTRCQLHTGRTTLVYGVGNPDAALMFVGEAPGREEDRQGIPFVGRAGQLLTKIIEAIELQRDDVYIANVIKCRPPNNRNPEPDEVRTCEPFLFSQIDAIRPRVIVALGSFAMRTLLRDDKTPISKARGRVYSFRGAKLIPTFHPAFLLRSPDRKRDVWEDMKRVRSILRDQ